MRVLQVILIMHLIDSAVERVEMYRLHEHEFHHAMPLGTLRCVYCGALKVHKPHGHHTKSSKTHEASIRHHQSVPFLSSESVTLGIFEDHNIGSGPGTASE